MTTRSVAAAGAETLLLRVGAYVVGFAATVLVARGLGPEGRGEYYLLVVAATTLASVAKLGIEQANVYIVGTKRLPVAAVYGQSGIVALVAGAFAAALMLLAPSLLPGTFGQTPVLLLALAAIPVPFSIHAQFIAGLQNLYGQVTWQFRAAIAGGVLQACIFGGLFLMSLMSVPFVLAANTVAVTVTWFLTIMGSGLRRTTWLRWDRDLLAESLRQSLLWHVGLILLFLHLRVDLFMVQSMAGPTAVGIYSVSVVLAETILLITDSVAVAVLPHQMSNSLPEAAQLAFRAVRIGGAATIAAALGWVAIGDVLVSTFFGQAFAAAYLPLVVLLPGITFLGVQRMAGAVVLRTGQARTMIVINAMSLLCNVLLNLWWIPSAGIVGAAAASSLSYGLSAFLFLWWMARIGGTSLIKVLTPRRTDAEAVLAAWREMRLTLTRYRGRAAR